MLTTIGGECLLSLRKPPFVALDPSTPPRHLPPPRSAHTTKAPLTPGRVACGRVRGRFSTDALHLPALVVAQLDEHDLAPPHESVVDHRLPHQAPLPVVEPHARKRVGHHPLQRTLVNPVRGRGQGWGRGRGRGRGRGIIYHGPLSYPHYTTHTYIHQKNRKRTERKGNRTKVEQNEKRTAYFDQMVNFYRMVNF